MRCAVLCVCAKGTSRQSGLQLRPLFDEWRRVPFVYDVPQCRAAEEVTEAIDIVAFHSCRSVRLLISCARQRFVTTSPFERGEAKKEVERSAFYSSKSF